MIKKSKVKIVEKKPASQWQKASVKVKLGEVDVYVKKPTNVYSPDYALIDETIEDIKKSSRKVCTLDYATNNVYVILQDALKKVRLAEK
jgi:hypothetical protein